MGILFDSAMPRHADENELLKIQSLNEFTEHPLLISIDNPVNKFADDFISFLNHNSKQSDTIPEPSIHVQNHLSIDGYVINDLIGVGGEALVYSGLDEQSNPVAIKLYKKIDHFENGLPREVSISNKLEHPGIVKILKFFEIQNQNEKSYVSIMPLATNGSFRSFEFPQLTIEMAVEFLLQIGSVLEYMHSQNIIHHDIKPGNVLIFDDGFRLSDFSVSIVLNDENQQINDRFGTSFFMAPEISRNSYFPKPTDMWSLGITLYVLLFGKLPFNLSQLTEPSTLPDFIRVTDNVMPYQLEFHDWPVIPPELRDILTELLNKDPEQRMTATQLVTNEWLQMKNHEWNELMNYLSTDDVIINSPISI